MTASDREAIATLTKLRGVARDWQTILLSAGMACNQTTRESLDRIEQDLSDLRFGIGIAIKEIEGGV